MTKEQIITESIKKGFRYDETTGKIYGISGKEIPKKKDGYIRCSLRLGVNTYQFYGHQFAWYCTYGEMPSQTIDHINCIKDDNRISNLRLVTTQQNSFNRYNVSGFVFCKRSGKYRAQIKVNGNLIHIGFFDTKEEAHTAYLEAKLIHHKI